MLKLYSFNIIPLSSQVGSADSDSQLADADITKRLDVSELESLKLITDSINGIGVVNKSAKVLDNASHLIDAVMGTSTTIRVWWYVEFALTYGSQAEINKAGDYVCGFIAGALNVRGFDIVK